MGVKTVTQTRAAPISPTVISMASSGIVISRGIASVSSPSPRLVSTAVAGAASESLASPTSPASVGALVNIKDIMGVSSPRALGWVTLVMITPTRTAVVSRRCSQIAVAVPVSPQAFGGRGTRFR